MNTTIIENRNKTIKLIKHASNGYLNCERFRNCILYTLNDDTTYYFTCIRNEPIIVEEDVILEDILNSLASISKQIDDIQQALIKNDDVDTSSDLDISKIDF